MAAYLLGDVLVCEDLQDRRWRCGARPSTDKTIVTLDGEVIDPHGVVTGGSRESAVAGILSQKREIRELEEVVARIEADLEAARGRQVDAQAGAGRRRPPARGDRRGAPAGRGGPGRRARRTWIAPGAIGRAAWAAAAASWRPSSDELRGALGRAPRSGSPRRARPWTTSAQAAVDAEALGGELRAETLALAERLDAMVGELATLKVAASQAEERRAARPRDPASGWRREREEHERPAGPAGDHRRPRRPPGPRSCRSRPTGCARRPRCDRAEAEERARDQAEREGAANERNAALSRREAELRAARERVTKLAQELGSLQLRCQEANLRRARSRSRCGDRYRDVRLAEVVFDYHLRHPVGREEEARMTELRGLIERMGEINLTAIEESAELQKRFDYLTTQKADLESAISPAGSGHREDQQGLASGASARSSTRSTRSSRRSSRAASAAGKAKLALTDESDLLETGVEIIANPPGKKVMQNIELLSGGEKAMTAVSLLFAIFLVKPSPFCVLDEVDAPLDEANVIRLNQMLREMTDRAQFIVITHNRRSMENADRLCGITMEEPGVSKLVAVNLRSTRKAGAAPAATPGGRADGHARGGRRQTVPDSRQSEPSAAARRVS